MGTARQHLEAVGVMVDLCGGLDALALTDLVRQLYLHYIDWRGLDDQQFLDKCAAREISAFDWSTKQALAKHS